jgi:hypothetical protein
VRHSVRLLSSLSAKQLQAIDLRDAGVGAVSATRFVKVLLQLSGEIREFKDTVSHRSNDLH